MLPLNMTPVFCRSTSPAKPQGTHLKLSNQGQQKPERIPDDIPPENDLTMFMYQARIEPWTPVYQADMLHDAYHYLYRKYLTTSMIKPGSNPGYRCIRLTSCAMLAAIPQENTWPCLWSSQNQTQDTRASGWHTNSYRTVVPMQHAGEAKPVCHKGAVALLWLHTQLLFFCPPPPNFLNWKFSDFVSLIWWAMHTELTCMDPDSCGTFNSWQCEKMDHENTWQRALCGKLCAPECGYCPWYTVVVH